MEDTVLIEKHILKILVVDDSLIMRLALPNYLPDEYTFCITTACNGEDALKKFINEKPHIVTLDMSMPGIGGLEVLKQMRKTHPASRILVVTALKDSYTALRAIRYGASGILNKPFDARRFRERLMILSQSILNES